MFWFYVLPLGFLLTMYTQTGYDASAHISEETHGAALRRRQGVWRSVFWSGVDRLVRAAGDHVRAPPTSTRDQRRARGSSLAVFATRADAELRQKVVVLIATIGQLFCGMACVTSVLAHDATRSRATAPCRAGGCGRGSTTTACRPTPCSSPARAALIITLPALEGDDDGVPVRVLRRRLDLRDRPLHRLRDARSTCAGAWATRSSPGRGRSGRKYKWINPAAIIWVAICVIIFCLPFTPAGVPWRDEFDWKYVNYAPITVGVRAADRRHLVAGAARGTRSPARCARSSSTTRPAS